MKKRTQAIAITAMTALGATVAFGQWTAPLALAPVAPMQEKGIKIDLDNATAKDALDWMKKAGIDFVVETSAIPKDKRFSIHIRSSDRGAIVKAIATAMGLNATEKGGIYTLSQQPIWTGQNGDLFVNPLDGEMWGKKLQESLEKSGEWQSELEDKIAKGNWAERDFPNGKVFLKGLPEGTLELKELEDLDKVLKELPGLDLKLKEMTELEKELKLKLKDLPKLKGLPGFDKSFKLKLKEMPKIDLKSLENLKDLSEIEVGLGDIGKLVDSLTPTQLETMKSKGFLTPDDLTDVQKKMLGDWGKDTKFQIVFEKDGKKVTIKGK